VTVSYQNEPVPFACIRRRKRERMEAFEARKRAERHRLKMDDIKLCARISRRQVLTAEAAAAELMERLQ
jgi:hypothetical protein